MRVVPTSNMKVDRKLIGTLSTTLLFIRFTRCVRPPHIHVHIENVIHSSN